MDVNKRRLEGEKSSFSATVWWELVLWHNWRKTAFVFSLMLTLLLDMASNPIISVMSVTGAVAISLSIGFTSLVWGLRKLKKSNVIEHPLKRYLEMDVTISLETAEQVARLLVVKLNPILLRLRSLFLIEDMLDSLKLLLLFCGLNVMGDYINGMSVVVLAFVMLFTLPKLYEWKKKTINKQLKQLNLLKDQLLCPRDKLNIVPTATVDPQFIETGLTQKSNFADDDNTNGSFISFEQESGQECTSDYNWPEEEGAIDDQPHIKQT